MKSIRETAEEIVKKWEGRNPIDTEDAANLSGAIEQSLRDRDERAAKIADKAAQKNQDALRIAAGIPGGSITQHGLLTARDEALEIAAAIRKED